MATSSTNSANPYLYKKTGFDPIKDFVPVASLGIIPNVMVVAAASSYKSPQDIVVSAKATPGKLSYGSGGVGNSAHLAGDAAAFSVFWKSELERYAGLVKLTGATLD